MRTIQTPQSMLPAWKQNGEANTAVMEPLAEKPTEQASSEVATTTETTSDEAPFDTDEPAPTQFVTSATFGEGDQKVELKVERVREEWKPLEYLEEHRLLNPIYLVETEIQSLTAQESDLSSQLESVRKELMASRDAKKTLLEALPGRLLALRDGREFAPPKTETKPVATVTDKPPAIDLSSRSTAEFIKGVPNLGEKKAAMIVDQYPTVADLNQARIAAVNERVHFSKKLPKGCGPGIADELTNRLLAAETGSDNEPPASEVVEPRTTDEAKHEQWLRANYKSLKASATEESLGADRGESWEDGFQDCNNGNEYFDCPIELQDAHKLEWLRGWMYRDHFAGDTTPTETEATQETIQPIDIDDKPQSATEAETQVVADKVIESLQELAERVKADANRKPRTDADTWNDGYATAIDEQPLEACPTSLSDDLRADWVRGWIVGNDTSDGL
jgi:hypothetical protein